MNNKRWRIGLGVTVAIGCAVALAIPSSRKALLEPLGGEPSRHGRTVSELIEALHDPDAGQRRLGAAVPALSEVAKDGHIAMRTWAVAEGLGKIGPSALPILSELLHDPSVRTPALAAVGNMGAQAGPAVPALCPLLKDKSRWTRTSACTTLGRIGPNASDAWTALTEALHDEDPRIGREAAAALQLIDPEAAAGAQAAPPPLAMLGLRYGSQPPQFGDLRLPAGDGPHPIAIIINGGLWVANDNVEYLDPFCRALTAAGWATWNIQYRGCKYPGGGWPGTFQDVAAATEHLRQLAPVHHLDLARVVVVGHSTGGQLALWLAGSGNLPAGHVLRPKTPLSFRGVVALAAVTDLRRAFDIRFGAGIVSAFLGGTPKEVPERYAVASPITMRPLDLPQVLFHGTEDQVVPLDMSADYQAARLTCGDRVKFISLPGANHAVLIDPDTPEGKQVIAIVSAMAP